MEGRNLDSPTYQTAKRSPSRFLRLMLVGLIVDFALLADPIDSIANSNLTVHMYQHVGLFVASIVFGYALDKYLASNLNVLKERLHFGWVFLIKMIKFNVRTKGLVFGAILPGIIFTFWHFPPNFDLAETSFTIHILEHLSYIIVGSLVGMSITAMTSKIRIGLLYFAFMQAGMMGSMMLIWPSFYPIYSAAQNLNMETSMMLFGAIGIIGTSSTLLKRLDIL
jgi:cytochrome c oxidase assembly factor CtaG